MNKYQDEEQRHSALEERLHKSFRADGTYVPRPSTLKRLHQELDRKPSIHARVLAWFSRPVPIYKPLGASFAACMICVVLLRLPSDTPHTVVYVQQPMASTIDTITKLVIDTIRLDLQRSIGGMQVNSVSDRTFNKRVVPRTNEYNGLRNLHYNARQSKGINVSDDSNVRRFIRSAPTEL